MQIRCTACGQAVTVAGTGVLPERCPHCQAAPVPARLGRWRIERLLAAGGMGEVYLARHQDLGSPVAIKLLPTHLGDAADALRERFLREARLTAAIEHPGVVRVLDLGHDQDRLFLVLEFVDGRSLRSRLRDGPLPIAEAVRIAAETADVLAAAHARGVVHRDIKPENLVLTPDGRVRVLDFGIAKALQDQEPITRTGEILGTPEYMAPEQLLEGPDAVDARTDVHALGVLLYELLTGRSPFAGTSLFQALKLVESLRPPPPSSLRSEVSAELDAVVLRALAKDREQRCPSAAEFAAALRRTGPAARATAAAPRRLAGPWPTLLLATAAFVLGLLLPAGGPRPATPAAMVDPAVRRTQASQRLDRWLTAPGAADEAQVDAALRDLDGELDGAQLATRGRVRWRRGEWLGALADLDRAHTLGVAAARDPALVAWHCVHTLLPTVVDAPGWLVACDRVRRDRLLGLGADAATVHQPGPVLRASRQLAAGDARAAWATLQSDGAATAAPEAATLALLAAHRACLDRSVLRAVTERLAPFAPQAVAELLRARVQTGERDNPALLAALTALGQERDPRSPEHWLVLLLSTWRRSLLEPTPPERLRALAELAWLSGAGEVAPVWLAALRLDQLRVDAPGHGVVATEATRLLHLCAPIDAADTPAVVPVRALLRLLTEGVARAESELAALPTAPDAELARFQAWRDGPATGPARELGRGVAWTLVGRRDNATTCFAPHLHAGDPSTGSMLAWLALAPGPSPGPPGGPLAEQWRRALALGGDLDLLGEALRLADAGPRVVYGLTQLFEQEPGNPVFGDRSPHPLLPLVRAALTAGVEPDPRQRVWQFLTGPALRPQWLTEVCGGVQ